MAANNLGVSKSYVSKVITALETRLGVVLFERTTRRVRVTEVGLDYYDRVLPLLRSADLVDATVQKTGEKLMGTIRLTFPVEFRIEEIMRGVMPFMNLHKALNLHCILSDRQLSLDKAEFDIAIRLQEFIKLDEYAKCVGETEMVLVASKNYLEQHGVPRDVDELLQHDLLSYSLRNSGNFWRVRTLDGEYHRVRADGSVLADNGTALSIAAESGQGIAFLPRFIIGDAIDKGRIVSLEKYFLPTPLYIHVVMSPSRASERAVEALYQHLLSSQFEAVWR